MSYLLVKAALADRKESHERLPSCPMVMTMMMMMMTMTMMKEAKKILLFSENEKLLISIVTSKYYKFKN